MYIQPKYNYYVSTYIHRCAWQPRGQGPWQNGRGGVYVACGRQIHLHSSNASIGMEGGREFLIISVISITLLSHNNKFVYNSIFISCLFTFTIQVNTKGEECFHKLEDPKWNDVNVVTSLLKSFFRKLPDPIFTTEVYLRYIFSTLLLLLNQLMFVYVHWN